MVNVIESRRDSSQSPDVAGGIAFLKTPKSLLKQVQGERP
jgi:hypothetical protein